MRNMRGGDDLGQKRELGSEDEDDQLRKTAKMKNYWKFRIRGIEVWIKTTFFMFSLFDDDDDAACSQNSSLVGMFIQI